MTRPYLLFQLHGSMAAWGDIAVGEMRTSFERPSRSALLGLIGAALGIRRDDEATHLQLAKDYGVAVEVRTGGSLLRDYHTVQRPPQRAKVTYPTRRAELTTLSREDLATTVSTRDYYSDAFYVVALWVHEGVPVYSLNEIVEALKKPLFTLYLGRKSCPLDLPLDPQLIEEGSVLKAFETRLARDRELKALSWLEVLNVNKQANFSHYSDESFDSAEQLTRIRRDQPISRVRWQFEERCEYYRLAGGQYGLSEPN